MEGYQYQIAGVGPESANRIMKLAQTSSKTVFPNNKSKQALKNTQKTPLIFNPESKENYHSFNNFDRAI